MITLNYCKNKTYFKQESLLEILQNAKMNDSKSMLYLINKYKPLILKYSTSYILKNYEKNDLIQIGSIAVIKATQKYDISHGENYIDCYIINSIKNSYRNLARTQIKYSSESSLNITLDEHDDIESLLKDDYNLENDIIKNMQHLELKNILNSLTDDEFNLIKVSSGSDEDVLESSSKSAPKLSGSVSFSSSYEGMGVSKASKISTISSRKEPES